MKRAHVTGTLLAMLAAFVFGLAACPQPTDSPKKPSVTVTVAELQAKVDEAKALLKEGDTDILFESEDGMDVDPAHWWVTSQIYSDLTSAINTAIEEIAYVTDNPNEKISASAMTNLVNAINAVTANRQHGTFGVGMVKISGTVAGAAWGEVKIFSDQECTNQITTQPEATITLNKTTSWDAWIDEDYAGQTIYARLTFTKADEITEIYSDVKQVQLPALENITPADGVSGFDLTVSQYLFDEFENIAPRATASSNNGASSVQNVNDKGSTAWASGSLTPTLDLDFIIPVKYNYIVLRSQGASAGHNTICDFEIDAWDDTAQEWITPPVYSETRNPSSTDSISGGTSYTDAKYGFPIDAIQTASKLRLKVNRGQASGVSHVTLFEIEVYLVPDRAAFAASLAGAKGLLQATKTSSTGSEVLVNEKWAAAADHTALSNAISDATPSFRDRDTSESDLGTALAALNNAVGTFRDTKVHDGLKMLKPSTNEPSKAKNLSTDTSVSFALTSTHDGTYGTESWSVYEEESGGTELATVSAAFSTPNLTLTATPGPIAGEEYWVAVTASGKTPSDRLKLTVTSAAGQTVQPVVSDRLILKEADSTTVSFTLTNTSDYSAGSPSWAITSMVDGEELTITGVTVAYAEPTLTLTHGTNVPYGTYWVAVTKDSQSQSDPVKLTVAQPLKVVRASIDHGAPSLMVVEFQDNVTNVDIAKFQVKMNDVPNSETSVGDGHSIPNPDNNPWLDHAIRERRTITAAIQGENAKIWKLTMSAPANYGEIIRLATLSNGGARNVSALLPKMPGLIVKNGVKRTRRECENTAGFYVFDRNGNPVDTSAAGFPNIGSVWSWINNQTVQIGYTYIISVDSDINYASDVTWMTCSSAYTLALDTSRATFIFTSADGGDHTLTKTNPNSGFNFSFNKGGVTFIIDEHITIKSNSNSSGYQYFLANNYGRTILDGTIKTYAATGDGRGPIGGAGCYFIMNSGTISDIRSSESPVFVGPHGAFVMHGGEISGNTVATYTPARMKGGGVSFKAQNGLDASIHGSVSFFMTGGEIKGNAVALDAASAAGGVLWAGEFQKTGGTIGSPGTITDNESANIKASHILVLQAIGKNPAAGDGAAFKKTAESGPDDTLFIECAKPDKVTAGVLKIPSWGASSWDTL